MQTTINKQQYYIYHTHNGIQLKDKAIGYNDAFYEIIEGERKGNLVHVWDVKTFDRIKQTD